MARGLCCQCRASLRLRVLSLGLLQDGDVRIGVFPECEKVILFANVVNGADIGMVTWLLNDGQTFRDGNLAESTATFL
jgi:hypothetical protein